MHKRVLVAESAEAIRSVAETVLRQNGFEVISLPTVEKAREVLQFSIPDVLIIGADLVADDGRPFYETIQSDPRTASVPLLLFDSTESDGLPFPDEVIISRPFDPKDFIQRVQVFSGQAVQHKPQPAGQVLPGHADLDDELLDHALGLDQIHVTESEVMDKTTGISRKAIQANGTMVGMSHHGSEDKASDSGKVESLMIRDDESAPATTHPPKQPAPPPQKQGSSSIEILSDQYGISEPSALDAERIEENHDYDWFINAMRDEGVEQQGQPPDANTAKASDSESLTIEQPSSAVDPITPVSSAGTTQAQTGQLPRAENSPRAAGVEKFIDEFREEMQRIRTAEEPPQIVTVKETKAATAPAASTSETRNWEEELERLSPADVALFSRQFASELAARIAEKIVAKIDNEKLLKLVAAEIAARARKK